MKQKNPLGNEEPSQLQKQILKRLNIITGLLLEFKPIEAYSRIKGDRVRILNEYELRPVEIAEVLGTSQTYVNKELSINRRGNKDKNK